MIVTSRICGRTELGLWSRPKLISIRNGFAVRPGCLTGFRGETEETVMASMRPARLPVGVSSVLRPPVGSQPKVGEEFGLGALWRVIDNLLSIWETSNSDLIPAFCVSPLLLTSDL